MTLLSIHTQKLNKLMCRDVEDKTTIFLFLLISSRIRRFSENYKFDKFLLHQKAYKPLNY